MVDNSDDNFRTRDERREHDRSRLIVDVFFDGKDATGVASTKDISIGGFYMSTQAEIPEGSLLLVKCMTRSRAGCDWAGPILLWTQGNYCRESLPVSGNLPLMLLLSIPGQLISSTPCS